MVRQDDGHRPEHLLAADLRERVHPVEDGREVVGAAGERGVVRGPATGDDPSARRHGTIDQRGHPVPVVVVDQRAEVAARIGAGTDAEPPGRPGQPLDDLLTPVAGDEDPRAGEDP